MMSMLSDKTERAAIVLLARCIKYFDGLANLNMTAEDDYQACSALRAIKGIIETNGYELVQTAKSVAVKKIKKHHGKRTV